MAAVKGVVFVCLTLGLILDSVAIPVKSPGKGEFLKS